MNTIEKAAHEAAIGIFDCAETPDDAKEIIMGHLAPIQAELDELAKIRSVIKDPAAVWINMLRGEIARPQALDHYEECKMRVETLQAELDEKDRLLREAREIVSDFADLKHVRHYEPDRLKKSQDWLEKVKE